MVGLRARVCAQVGSVHNADSPSSALDQTSKIKDKIAHPEKKGPNVPKFKSLQLTSGLAVARSSLEPPFRRPDDRQRCPVRSRSP
eukprot:1909631-Rhodomonas_salina.2